MNLILLRHFIAVYFSISTFICLIIGDTKVNNIKRINSHVVFFLLFYISILSWVDIYFDLNTTSVVNAVKIHLNDFIIPCLVISAFSAIAVHISKNNILDVILHITIATANAALLFLGVYYQSSVFKACALASFVVFLIHVGFQVNSDYQRTPNMVATLTNAIITYTCVYIFTIILGPYWQNIIGSSALEIIFMLANAVMTAISGTLVVHYSWSIHNNNLSTSKPDDIANYISSYPQKLAHLIDSRHSF